MDHKTSIGFTRYILQMELQIKQILRQSCIWTAIQKEKKNWHSLFKHSLPTKKTRAEESEMEI